MDIKEQIEKVFEAVTKDNSLLDKFKKDPVQAVKGLLSNSLADDNDLVEKIVAGVKAKLSADKVSDVVGALGKLFDK